MCNTQVQAETEWQYDPYESAKPKFSTLAKARVAIAKMEEEEVYKKYYSIVEHEVWSIASEAAICYVSRDKQVHDMGELFRWFVWLLLYRCLLMLLVGPRNKIHRQGNHGY